MIYRYKGRDSVTLSREELLMACRAFADTAEMRRRAMCQDAEMETLFDDTRKRLADAAHRLPDR